MDPVEGVVETCVEAGGFEDFADAGSHGEVGVEDVGLVFGGVHVRDGGFGGFGVCRDFDGVAEGGPVCSLCMVRWSMRLGEGGMYHHHDVLDSVG